MNLAMAVITAVLVAGWLTWPRVVGRLWRGQSLSPTAATALLLVRFPVFTTLGAIALGASPLVIALDWPPV